MKPLIAVPKSKIAVEILYGGIDALPHPDQGVIRLVYFGHKSEGQKKITRQVSEAVVLLLEANGLLLHNGLTEAADALRLAGWSVESPGDPKGEPVKDSPAVAAVNQNIDALLTGRA